MCKTDLEIRIKDYINYYALKEKGACNEALIAFLELYRPYESVSTSTLIAQANELGKESWAKWLVDTFRVVEEPTFKVGDFIKVTSHRDYSFTLYIVSAPAYNTD